MVFGQRTYADRHEAVANTKTEHAYTTLHLNIHVTFHLTLQQIAAILNSYFCGLGMSVGNGLMLGTADSRTTEINCDP